MTKPPIFTASQLTRLDDFAISTFIFETSKQRYVIKKPVTPKAKKHLAKMLVTYRKLTAIAPLVKKIKPVAPTAQPGGELSFPFINGKNVERQLIEAIIKQKPAEALAIIARWLTIIESLPTKKINPALNPRFVRCFGTAYNSETECVTLGVVDFNLDNVISVKDDWYLIDYEWAFDFAIPKDFIIKRFFYWFFIARYQGILAYHSERLECLAIARDVLVPKYIYNEYRSAFTGIDKVMQTESKFQQFVNGGHAELRPINLYANALKAPTAGISLIEDYLQNLNLPERVKVLSTELEAMRQTNRELEAQLNHIRSSKLYRLAKRAKKIVPKKY